MNLDVALQEALLAALNSPEGQRALRRAIGQSQAPTTADDQAYTVAQVAQLSGFTHDTVVGHITSGNLRAYKPTGCREWRIRRADFRAWLTGAGENPVEQLDPDQVAQKMLARGGR
jgi:excisionase family DNA binding protein